MNDELIKRAEGWLKCYNESSLLGERGDAAHIIQDLLTALKGKGWMPIKSDVIFTDDCKKKHSSIEAKFTQEIKTSRSGAFGTLSVEVYGYGANQDEAYEGLLEAIQPLVFPTPPNDSEEK